jgi:hypothetical protein
MPTRVLGVALALALSAACSKTGANDSAPSKPATGAPVAFELTSLSKDGLSLRAYNFTDKELTTFEVNVRYKDAQGKVLKVQPGSPFAKDYEHVSFSGTKYAEAPGKWTTLKLDSQILHVPSDAAKAEVMLTRAAVGIEKAVWEYPGFGWPSEKS